MGSCEAFVSGPMWVLGNSLAPMQEEVLLAAEPYLQSQ